MGTERCNSVVAESFDRRALQVAGTPDISFIMPGRTRAVTQLEAQWRERLEVAALRYAEAKQAAIHAAEEGVLQTPQALELEKACLSEYTEVLTVFTRLVIDGVLEPGSESLPAVDTHPAI
jgi:hypothetical protein